jgi:hypothetical protein
VSPGKKPRTLDGGIVTAALPVPGTDDCFVLLDPEHRPEGVLPWHPFLNILRVTSSGEVKWRAELVPGETTWKCWLGVDWTGPLRAWSGSYECELDPNTGRIVRSTFTK